MVSRMKSVESTYQKPVNCLGYFILWARYGDYITCHFGTGEVDFAIEFFFERFDLIHTSDELSMVQAVDDDRFRDKVCVLYGGHMLDI